MNRREFFGRLFGGAAAIVAAASGVAAVAQPSRGVVRANGAGWHIVEVSLDGTNFTTVGAIQ